MLSGGLNFFVGLNLPQSAASKIFIFFFTLLICIYFKLKNLSSFYNFKSPFHNFKFYCELTRNRPEPNPLSSLRRPSSLGPSLVSSPFFSPPRSLPPPRRRRAPTRSGHAERSAPGFEGLLEASSSPRGQIRARASPPLSPLVLLFFVHLSLRFPYPSMEIRVSVMNCSGIYVMSFQKSYSPL
jgi:hypothetical protein